MGADVCCAALAEAARLDCDLHSSPHDCPDVLIIRSDQHGVGLPVRDGGSSFVTIDFCPWCGTRLPEEETTDGE